jgi:hypothetical protein
VRSFTGSSDPWHWMVNEQMKHLPRLIWFRRLLGA